MPFPVFLPALPNASPPDPPVDEGAPPFQNLGAPNPSLYLVQGWDPGLCSQILSNWGLGRPINTRSTISSGLGSLLSHISTHPRGSKGTRPLLWFVLCLCNFSGLSPPPPAPNQNLDYFWGTVFSRIITPLYC